MSRERFAGIVFVFEEHGRRRGALEGVLVAGEPLGLERSCSVCVLLVDDTFKAFRFLDGDITGRNIRRIPLYSSMNQHQHQQHIFIRNIGFHEHWLLELCEE